MSDQDKTKDSSHEIQEEQHDTEDSSVDQPDREGTSETTEEQTNQEDSSNITNGQADEEAENENFDQLNEEETSNNTMEAENNSDSADIWPQLRKLLVFQVKLYIDAFRDLLMSPLSIVVFFIDLVQKNQGENALFESLLQFGRKTERAINLFNQHDTDAEDYRGIDSILNQVEEGVRKEYKEGSVSGNAKDSIDKSVEKLREILRKKDAR